MEPQHNYPSYNAGFQQQVYGRKRSKKGCFAAGIIIVLLIISGSLFLAYFIYNKTNNTLEEITEKFRKIGGKEKFVGSRNEDSRFTGAFVDALEVPVPGSTPVIFLLTDASRTYIETKKRPGYYSTGAACIDCKTIAYIYDPISDKIITNTDVKFPDIISSTELFIKDDRVYQFTKAYGETPAGVNIYDSRTAKLLSETTDFISAYPELSAGITELNVRAENKTVNFETKDGRKKIIYSIELQKIFKDDKSFRTAIESTAEGEGYIYGMASEDNDSRKQLHKITAPAKYILSQRSILMSYADRNNMLKSYSAHSVRVSDKNYIEGIIYAQDENNVLIISLTAAGKKSERIFTCVDAGTGAEKWSVQQNDLFDYMKIDEEQNSAQSFFSTKDKITVSIHGALVLLKLKGDGVIGFDSETGRKMWSIQPAPAGF